MAILKYEWSVAMGVVDTVSTLCRKEQRKTSMIGLLCYPSYKEQIKVSQFLKP
jgi:hypothetical protein